MIVFQSSLPSGLMEKAMMSLYEKVLTVLYELFAAAIHIAPEGRRRIGNHDFFFVLDHRLGGKHRSTIYTQEHLADIKGVEPVKFAACIPAGQGGHKGRSEDIVGRVLQRAGSCVLTASKKIHWLQGPQDLPFHHKIRKI